MILWGMRFFVLLAWMLLVSFATVVLPIDSQIAQRAVTEWKEGKLKNPVTNPKTLEDIRAWWQHNLNFPPAPSQLSVNLEDAKVTQTAQGTRYAFTAVSSGQGGVVQVVVKDDKVIQTRFVSGSSRIPSYLSNPLAWIIFVAALLAWIILLVRGKSLLSLWWKEGWALVRQYWPTYIWVNVLLYGSFILGSLTGYAAPELVQLVREIVQGSLNQIGIESFANNPLSFMTAIFYWNFLYGLIITTTIPAALFGIPALLVNFFRYLVLGVALSPIGFPLLGYVVHLPTVVTELQGYILVTFGGMVLLQKVLAKEGYKAGWQALGTTVYLGTFFLAVAACYEAISLTLIR
jgi:hypothetical protein